MNTTTSLDLRRRAVAAYRNGLTKTYEATAEMFGIGRATVSRALRRERETGDVQLKPRGGNNPRVVDLAWLRAHAEANPDDRLADRVTAWVAQGGKPVSDVAMSSAMRAIGWTHKKRRRSPTNANAPTSRRSAKPSLRRSRSLKPAG